MVKKKSASKPKISRKETAKKVPIKTDIASVEEETMKRTDKTIATIEAFLERWDTARMKPDDMFPQIAKIRQFHDALVEWQKEALKSKGKTAEGVKRLRNLVLICKTYS
jgi:hypothetical protein